jgi:hypothetical protein
MEILKARLEGLDYGIDDRGFPVLYGGINYSDENKLWFQGFPFDRIDEDFIVHLLKAAGVNQLSELDGMECIVTRVEENFMNIPIKIEFKTGTFHIDAWRKRKTEEWERND